MSWIQAQSAGAEGERQKNRRRRRIQQQIVRGIEIPGAHAHPAAPAMVSAAGQPSPKRSSKIMAAPSSSSIKASSARAQDGRTSMLWPARFSILSLTMLATLALPKGVRTVWPSAPITTTAPFTGTAVKALGLSMRSETLAA